MKKFDWAIEASGNQQKPRLQPNCYIDTYVQTNHATHWDNCQDEKKENALEKSEEQNWNIFGVQVYKILSNMIYAKKYNLYWFNQNN